MTGRELIIYILENHLEDEPVFKDGAFVGYVSDKKFAEMFGVGLATVHAWASLSRIDDMIVVGDTVYIPITCATRMKAALDETQGSDCKCKTN